MLCQSVMSVCEVVVWDVCLCLGCGGDCDVGGSGLLAWPRVWEGGVVLCLYVL